MRYDRIEVNRILSQTSIIKSCRLGSGAIAHTENSFVFILFSVNSVSSVVKQVKLGLATTYNFR